MKKIFLLLTIATVSFSASAIQYVKGSGKITVDEFDKCGTKIYRKSGQSELSPDNKAKASQDILVGKSINDLEALKKYLGEHPEACSYGIDGEKF